LETLRRLRDNYATNARPSGETRSRANRIHTESRIPKPDRAIDQSRQQSHVERQHTESPSKVRTPPKPKLVVETAIQEDADAVGISLLSGAHMTLVPRILDLLRENGADDVLVVLGGTIPEDDADELKRQGVAAVFGPGAPTTDIIEFLKSAVPA